MAVNYLLKIDGAGIKGESPVDGYKDYIEITSFQWSASQKGTFAYGGGGGGGAVTMQDFHFEMKCNKASPKLMEACANGSHVKTATLVCRKAGGKSAVEFVKVVMTDVLVSSYQCGGQHSGGQNNADEISLDRRSTRLTSSSNRLHGGTDEIPLDQISLNFAKVEFNYKDQKADGTAGTAFEGSWDLKKMKTK